MAHNTMSASAILESLRSMEKNPFAATHSTPLTAISSRPSVRTGEVNPHKVKKATPQKEYKSTNIGSTRATHSSNVRVAKFVEVPCHDPVEAPSINDENMPLLEKDDYSAVKSQSIKSDLQRELNRMFKIEKRTERHLDDAVAMIPAHYFVSHKMFDQIKSKALDSVWSILQKMRLRLLRLGMSLWRAHAKELTAVLRQRMALVLCRIVRGFLGRRRAKYIHRKRLADMKARSKTNAIALMNRGERALLIQTTFRCWRVYRPFQRRLVRHRAALVIQRRYLSYRNEGRFVEAVQEVIMKMRAARRIQRAFRGLLGRMKARIVRSQQHRSKIEARYATAEGVFEFYFEQNGAALRIQRWYKNLWWVRRIKGNERREKRRRMLDGKARVIQRRVRGMLGRQRAVKEREIKRLRANTNIRLVILVQAVARRFLTHKRHRGVVDRLAKLRAKRIYVKQLNIGSRRNAISFEHLKIGNERNIMRMDRKARIIQKTYKSFRVLRYFTNMIKFRKVILVNKIQRWYRTWVWRHGVYAALRVIQPVWKFKMYKYLKKKYAAYTVSVL